MQNRQLIFSPQKPYDLVADRSEAASNSLRFSKMWTRGESNSRLSNANAVYYHYTTGPPELSGILDFVAPAAPETKSGRMPRSFALSVKPWEIFNARQGCLAKFPAKDKQLSFAHFTMSPQEVSLL